MTVNATKKEYDFANKIQIFLQFCNASYIRSDQELDLSDLWIKTEAISKFIEDKKREELDDL